MATRRQFRSISQVTIFAHTSSQEYLTVRWLNSFLCIIYPLTGASAVQVHGVVISTPTSNSLGTYTINSQTSTISGPSSSVTQYPVVDFGLLTASNLDPSVYNTLEITAGGASVFYLDYLLLDADQAFISESVPSICDGPVGGDGRFDSGGGGGDGGQPEGHVSNGVGAITGGVVGAVVGLAIFGFVVWTLTRRWKRQRMVMVRPSVTERGDNGASFTPMMLPHHDHPVSARGANLGQSIIPTRLSPAQSPDHQGS